MVMIFINITFIRELLSPTLLANLLGLAHYAFGNWYPTLELFILTHVFCLRLGSNWIFIRMIIRPVFGVSPIRKRGFVVAKVVCEGATGECTVKVFFIPFVAVQLPYVSMYSKSLLFSHKIFPAWYRWC
jgi:hypothetical protein